MSEARVPHGGDLATAQLLYGGKPEDWIDLSTGINPWPYPLPEVPAEAWTHLPQPDRLAALIEAARTAYAAPAGASIVAASGTQAIIQTLPTLFSPRRVAVVSPTYGEHAPAWQNAGHMVREVPDITGDTDVLIVCSPNNPDGRIVDASIVELADESRLVVIDEAFADVLPKASLAARAGQPGLVILRSFGKFYGLAGLRLGFALGEQAMIAALTARLGPWAVSGPALEIGRAALADHAWLEATRTELSRAAARLDQTLSAAGLTFIGGTDLYRLAETPSPARTWHEQLAHAHIWTRPFPTHPRWLRFGLPGSEPAWQRLCQALNNLRTHKAA